MFKKFGRGFSSTVLKISLYLLASATAFVVVFGTAQRIKIALVKSNVYNTFVDSALDKAKESQKDQSGGEINISLADPIVREAAKKAITPQLLQTSSESAIDGVYGWLQQKTTQPQFVINLTEAKQTFATTVSNSLATRIEALPVCTLAQLRTLDVNNLDLFTLPCRPPGVDIAAQRQKVVDDIVNNKDFLKDTVITAENLPKDEQGRTAAQQLSDVPKLFRLTMVTPWVLGVVIILCIVGVVVLFEDKRRTLRSLWITFLSVGLVLLLSFWLTDWALKRATTSDTVNAGGNFNQSGLLLAKSLANDVNAVTLRFVVVYLGLAGLLALWWWLWGRKSRVVPHTVPHATSATPAVAPQEKQDGSNKT